MKKTYRGWELEAKREMSLGGDELLYYSLFDPEGCEIASGPYSGDETVREFIRVLQNRVDAEILERPNTASSGHAPARPFGNDTSENQGE